MVIVARTIDEFLRARRELGQTGLVTTMGALHQGHLSLIRRAKKENDFAIVTIFVNPTQFGANEDYDKYPRKEDADITLCKAAGADILFMPNAGEMYNENEPKVIAPIDMASILEGEIRKGHFDGVLTIVLKLFNLAKPAKAYFGKKDAQQLIIITKMAERFFMNLTIVPCETVRENGGLAMSSRNVYLSEEEKISALKLSESLFEVSKMVIRKEYRSEAIKAAMREILSPLEIDYVAIVDRELKSIDTIAIDNTIVLAAARVGKTRLIDNIWI